MKFLTLLLLIPALLGVSNFKKNNNNLTRTEYKTNEITSNAVSNGDEIIVDLNPEPYYKKDYFSTSFQYPGYKKAKEFWFESKNVDVKWEDRRFFEEGIIDVDIYCYEKTGSFTLNIMNESKSISKLSVFTRLTEFGIFASTGSQTVCDNKVIAFEYRNGYIKDEELTRLYGVEVLKDDYSPKETYLQKAEDDKTVFEGDITWEDYFGRKHPCCGLYYEIHDDENGYALEKIPLARGYLTETGHYSFAFDSCELNNGRLYLVLISAGEYIELYPEDGFRAHYSTTLTLYYKEGYINSKNYCYEYNDINGWPMQIVSCLYWGQKFMDTYNDGDVRIIKVLYPAEHTRRYNFVLEIGEPYFECPDIVLHEFGHEVEGRLGLFDFWHRLDYSGNHTFWEDYTLTRNKAAALRRNYSETLASVIGFLIENEYPQYFKSIYRACDASYDDLTWYPYNRKYDPLFVSEDTDFETLSEDFLGGADAYELSTGALLWDLYDTDSEEEWDEVKLGTYSFMYILRKYKPTILNELLLALYEHNLVDFEKLGKLLTHHGFTARNVRQKIYSSTRSTIFWDHSGNLHERSSLTIGDEYILKFYSADNEFLFETTVRGKSYTIPANYWQLILDQPGAYYNVRIGAKSTRGDYTTGPYYCETYSFYKTNDGYAKFDVSKLGSQASGESTTGGISLYGIDSFASMAGWRSANIVTNNKGDKFLCLNPGLDSNNLSYLILRTQSTFTSVSFDLVFKTNRSILTGTTIEVYKYRESYCFEAAEIDPFDIGMDMNTDRRYTFAIPMGGDADGFQIRITGYGYTALCIRNIIFEK